VQVAALDEAHTHIQAALDFAVVVDRDHVRGVELCRRLGFAAKPLLELFVV